MATSVNGSGTSSYTVNNDNQVTAKTGVGARTLTYDPQGNEITDTGKTLAYNYDNQLKQLVSGSTTTNYAYDATGNRTYKTQTGTSATNYQYINAGNNRVLQAKNLTTTTNQYYLYGLDQISQGDTASSTRQYSVTGGNGNVRYLTSSTGTVVSNGTFVYDSYGKQVSGSATLSNYTYQGEQKDNESGLTYLRARYYDPTLGRFTAQDPLRGSLTDPAGQNGYNYANDNPVNLNDPLGLAASCGGKNAPTISSAFNKIRNLSSSATNAGLKGVNWVVQGDRNAFDKLASIPTIRNTVTGCVAGVAGAAGVATVSFAFGGPGLSLVAAAGGCFVGGTSGLATTLNKDFAPAFNALESFDGGNDIINRIR